MMKTIVTLSAALLLSACATGQPVTNAMHNCKHHCEMSHCKHGEKCACEGCKRMKETGKTCPEHGPEKQ